MSAFGPETITITQMNPGTYRCSVHDYSNRASTTSAALGQSGAKVQVYSSTGITPVNGTSFFSDPSTILTPPSDAWGGNDALLIWQAVRDHPKRRP